MAADFTFRPSLGKSSTTSPLFQFNVTTPVVPLVWSTLPPYYYRPSGGRGSSSITRAKDQTKVLSKEEVIEEYYAAYDVMTGIRIGATLGGLIALFTLFLVYKSKCRAYREAVHKAREKARIELEETKRMEHFKFASRSAVLGSRRYYSPAGVAALRGNVFMGAVECDSESTTPSSDNVLPKDTELPIARPENMTVPALLRPRPSCFVHPASPVGSSALSDISTSSSSKNSLSKTQSQDKQANVLLESTHSIPPRHESESTHSKKSKSQPTSASEETTAPAISTEGSKIVISHCNPLLYQRDSQASTSGESAVLNLPVSTTEAETSSGDVSLTVNYPSVSNDTKQGTKPNSETIRIIVQKEE